MSRRRSDRQHRPDATSFALLEADGGWLTADGISAAGGGKPSSIERSMQRWRREGLVESRSIALAAAGRGLPPETRHEWRIVTPTP